MELMVTIINTTCIGKLGPVYTTMYSLESDLVGCVCSPSVYMKMAEMLLKWKD